MDEEGEFCDSERNMSSRRSGRNAGVSRDPGSPDDSHLNLTVKVAPGKLRQATRGAGGRNSESFEGGEILSGKRNRGGKKSYVVDSSPDDDEEEDELELDDEEEEDAEGEDAMDMDAEGDDVDAEGEEDAEGDIDMSAAPSPARPTIKVTSKAKPAPRGSALKVVQDDDDDDDEDDLSDPGDSDEDGDQTMGLGDETMADEDAEGEEIEVVGEDDEEEEDDEDAEGEDDDGDGGAGLDSDADISREDTPDVTKMTKRQRARFEEGPGEFMKLSDEVQAKKVFTAEELSMRRQEMARRRRNLSEKRNEEVKMETINKLLKKQAPKINKKAAAAAAAAEMEEEEAGPNPAFVRWVNNKSGSMIGVPKDMAEGPAGRMFANSRKMGSGKMVEEVA